MEVNECEVRFQLDSSADVNTIQLSLLEKNRFTSVLKLFACSTNQASLLLGKLNSR